MFPEPGRLFFIILFNFLINNFFSCSRTRQIDVERATTRKCDYCAALVVFAPGSETCIIAVRPGGIVRLGLLITKSTAHFAKCNQILHFAIEATNRFSGTKTHN